MSDAPSEKRCRIVPESDLKCVWMTAGILSYQLCERRFDCESCPLDQAMRMHFARGAAHDAPAAPAWRGGPLAADRCYSRSHCWVKRGRSAGPGTSLHRVGLEPGFAAALRVPHAVVAPTAGEEVRRGRAHLWFVTEGGTFALGAPLDGVVHAVNPQLTQRPATVATSPMEEGWMYDLVVADDSPQLASLLDAGTAERGYSADAGRFQAGLARALRDSSTDVGATLADGGAPLDDVAAMLGPSRYFALLCKVYG